MNWRLVNAGSVYRPLCNIVEHSEGIPPDLLARIAFQESSWRMEVITGIVKSKAGAVGIMQLMPEFFPQAGQDAGQDIQTAGRLLKSLFNRFGNWQLAVAAYNDGQGNVHAFLKLGRELPAETRTYVAQVMGDVKLAGPLVDISGLA